MVGIITYGPSFCPPPSPPLPPPRTTTFKISPFQCRFEVCFNVLEPIHLICDVNFTHAFALIQLFEIPTNLQGKLFQRHLEFFKRHLKNWTPIVLFRLKCFDRPTLGFGFSSGDPSALRALNVSGGGDEHDRTMFSYRPYAYREQKMEVVSRLLIRKFRCRVTGGFIRDWVINGQREVPSGVAVENWIEKSSFGGWELIEGIVPKDIDVELALDSDFDVVRFICLVRACGISVDVYDHKPQRHCFVFDRLVGPFTVDIIGNILPSSPFEVTNFEL